MFAAELRIYLVIKLVEQRKCICYTSVQTAKTGTNLYQITCPPTVSNVFESSEEHFSYCDLGIISL